MDNQAPLSAQSESAPPSPLHASTTTRSTDRAFIDWINERFPWKNASLFFVLYVTTATVARTSAPESSMFFSLFDIAGCLLAWGFFLVVRIFDEHKDFDKDLINHPQRVLQSGRLTLGKLRIIATTSIGIQILISILIDKSANSASPQTTLAWLALFGWLCLMGKEFFCGDWLERHLLLYAVSHMAIMPFIVYWFAQLALPGISFNAALICLSALALLSGFAFEITRKTWGPEEERDTIDSYARTLGLQRAVHVIAILLVGMTLIQIGLIWYLSQSFMSTILSGIVLTTVLVTTLRIFQAFIATPTSAGRKKNEVAVGIATLTGYLTLIVVLVATQPISLVLF